MVETPEAPSSLGQNVRLGDRLIQAGVLTETQLALAVREQKRRGGLLSDILLELGRSPPCNGDGKVIFGWGVGADRPGERRVCRKAIGFLLRLSKT